MDRWFADDGEHGALCRRKKELRPFSYSGTDPLHRSRDVPGQVGFCGYGIEEREPYVQKHNLHNTKQKTGVIPQGAKKWVLGVFLAYRCGDGRLIKHVSIGRISIYTAIGIGVYMDSCISACAVI